jgi:uncharacterized phiE125 gp8 family phage protein
MMSELRMVAPPAPEDEPLQLPEVNFHLRITTDATDASPQWEDPLVQALIYAARDAATEFIDAPIAPATYEARFDSFHCDLNLPAPLQRVLQVEYAVGDNLTFQMPPEQYRVLGSPRRPYLALSYGASWPSDALRDPGAVRVQFVAGYGGSGLGAPPLPASIRQAMLLMIGHWYKNRESEEMPPGARHLLQPFRMGMGL